MEHMNDFENPTRLGIAQCSTKSAILMIKSLNFFFGNIRLVTVLIVQHSNIMLLALYFYCKCKNHNPIPTIRVLKKYD